MNFLTFFQTRNNHFAAGIKFSFAGHKANLHGRAIANTFAIEF